MPTRFAQRSIASLMSVALAASVVTPAAWAQNTRAATAAKFRGSPVTLNFVNAEIEGVARAMGAILGQQFVVDPRVKGQITLYTDQPVSPREAYANFLAALRGLGFTVVEVGGLYKILPEADAKLQAGTVAIGGGRVRGDQVLTQIFKLTHENANNLVPVLRPLISPNNTINANPGNNSLVITDYADNLERIGKIIAAMDTPASGDVEVITLQHAVASDIVQLIQRLTDSSGATNQPGVVGAQPGVVGGAGSTASVMVDQRSNSLLVRAPNPAKMAAIRSLVEKLDRPIDGANGMGNIWVVYLKNADAVRLATVLRAAYAATQNNASGSGGAGGGASTGSPFSSSGGAAQAQNNLNTANSSSTNGGASAQSTAPVNAAAGPSTGGFVQADPATNSLIITAPEPMYRQLRAMIDQLDTRRAQVYIESMIVEVTGDDSTDLGFQWQGLAIGGREYIPAAGTNFGSSGAGSILGGQAATSAVGAIAATGLQAGLNIGIVKNYGGTYGLAAIAHALQSRGDTNIVSTPNLVTLDNEEAKIIVGQNVPFVTGSYATTSGTSTTSPFTTVDRKDVGVTLRIKPQIGENGTVRMTIYQESSSIVAQATGTAALGPTTNKKSIESSVVVDDGSIIVLGGLIEDTVTITNDKVPVLGDIPYLGALFRSESRTKHRSNQMVFLRPTVMRDGRASDNFSIGKYDMIRAEQSRNQVPTSGIQPIGSVPVLPPIVPGGNPLVPLAAPPAAEGKLRPVAPAASDIPPPIIIEPPKQQ